MEKVIITKTEEETQNAAAEFAQSLKPGTVICLYGELGAGKTTFSKGLARGLGVSSRIISPTFTLVRQHQIQEGKGTLYHLDLYRLEREEDVRGIGFEEMVQDKNGIMLIEWAEKLGKLLPSKRIDIRLEAVSAAERKISIQERM